MRVKCKRKSETVAGAPNEETLIKPTPPSLSVVYPTQIRCLVSLAENRPFSLPSNVYSLKTPDPIYSEMKVASA